MVLANSNVETDSTDLWFNFFDDKCDIRGFKFIYLKKKKMEIVFDAEKKVPAWVSHDLFLSDLLIKPRFKRSSFNFEDDPDIPEAYRCYMSLYLNSGYSRGHMATASYFLHDSDQMKETFYSSNIAPFNIDLNSNFWNNLENYMKTLAINYGYVKIITGSLFLPSFGVDNRLQMIYDLIGKDNNFCSVPTHFYKIALIVDQNKPEVKYAAFIVPNTKIENGAPIFNFAVTLQMIESLTNHNLVFNLRLTFLSVFDYKKSNL